MKKLTYMTLLCGFILALTACKDDKKDAEKAEPEKTEKAPAEEGSPKDEPAEKAQDKQGAPVDKGTPEEEPTAKVEEKQPAPGEEKKPKEEPTKGPDEQPPTLADTLGDLTALLPDDTLFLGAISMSGIGQYGDTMLDIPFVELAPEYGEKLTKAYKELLLLNTGLDFTKVKAIVLFVSAQQYVGILVLGDTTVGSAASTQKLAVADRDVYSIPELELTAVPNLTKTGGTALFIEEEQAKSYIKWVLSGEKAMKAETYKRLTEPMATAGDAWFAGVVDLNNPFIAMAWASGVPLPKPDRVAITLSQAVLKVTLEGNQGSCDGILGAWEMGRAAVLQQMAKERSSAADLDFMAGIGLVGIDETLNILFDAYKPARTASGLELEFDLALPGVSSVGFLGIMSAIAVPAFIKYMRKAKTSEAIDQLDKIYKGVADYLATPKVDENGNFIPCKDRIPKAEITPAASCCAQFGGPDKDGDDRCDADPSFWDKEPWSTIGFAITDPHYYVYTVGPDAHSDDTFTITAYGDLDCDGIQSTFQRFGRIEMQGDECTISSAAALFTQNETE